MKSQASTEFLIILSLVLFLSIITISIINPSSIFNFTQKHSDEYWSTSIISLQVATNDTNTILYLRNNLRSQINLTSINLGSTNISFSPEILPSGNRTRITSNSIVIPGLYAVKINYSIEQYNFSFDGNNVKLLVKSLK